MDPRPIQRSRPPCEKAPPGWSFRLRAAISVAFLLMMFSLATACASGDARSNSESPGKKNSATLHQKSTASSTAVASKMSNTKKTSGRERTVARQGVDLSGKTPAAAAYKVAASGLRGISPDSVGAVYRSVLDPSWSSVRISEPGGIADFVVFLREKDGIWRARYSILADDPDHPENDTATLEGVPDDLLKAIYPEQLASFYPGLHAEATKPEDLPTVDRPRFAPPAPVVESASSREARLLEPGVEEVKKAVEGYDGVAGVYVRDLNGGWGYGVRPDEEFFSASVIKVPVMVAVYREIDQGKLSISDTFATRPEDWASGAGTLQWETAGTPHTVGDYLSRMITQSDNVAANALVRVVGGASVVNQVARSMGASDTLLYEKITSERAMIPALDNRTTPRDMTAMLQQIAAGKAASPESCKAMVELLRENTLESWLEAGIPKGVAVANKAGWIYKVYDEVGIVFHRKRPYAVAILSEGGPANPSKAKPGLKEISAAVWQTQSLP